MRCITVLGPSQSGKSTLTGALARLDGTPPKPESSGPVTLRPFTYLGDPWLAVDIAGGPENLGHAGQALAGSDAAVLCLPPEPEAAVLAAPYIRLVEEAGTPCLLFINRMDEAQARVRDIVAALQGYSRHAIVLRQVPMREDGHVTGAVDLISERAWAYREGRPSALIEIPDAARDREQEARGALLEHLADYDDALLEQLIEDRQPATDTVFALASKVLEENVVMPAFLGAASHMNGVNRLMKSLRHEAPPPAATRARHGDPVPLAVGLHASVKKHLGKAVLIRAFEEGITAAGTLGGESPGALTGLDGKTSVARLAPGEAAFAVKSDHLNAGQLYSARAARPLPGWARGHRPSFCRVLTPVRDRDDARLSAALARLDEIDPGLALATDEATGHAAVMLQGPMHLRRVLASLAETFGVEVTDSPAAPSYRETIAKPVSKHYRHRKQSGGAGQFADVQLEVRPLGRGEGFAFAETVKGGAVPRAYIPAVEAGCRDALEDGPLGFRVTDIAVTLTDGKAHAVDSSDFAFRTAARQGVKAALAEGSPVLLQPIDRITFHVPSVFSGALVQLVGALKGQVLGFDANPDAPGWDIFRALLPAAAHDDIDRSLGGATQGTAWYEAAFDHYEELHGKAAESVSKSGAAATA